jgi:hypothetical protein
VAAVFVLGIVAAIAGYAISISRANSPEQVVRTYFDAQKRGDVNAMMSTAHYMRGDGAYERFFDRSAVAAMVEVPQNRDIRDLKVVSTKNFDSSTAVVTVSMNWAGMDRTVPVRVRKNSPDLVVPFLTSWSVEMWSANITLELPIQAGKVSVDGIEVPGDAPASVQVIAAFHKVDMAKTPLYDGASHIADAVTGEPNVALDGNLSQSVMASAAKAIKAGALVCDPVKYYDCAGHKYVAPIKAGFVYYLTMPGYGEVDYASYVFTLTGDMTKGMKVTPAEESGRLFASGKCTVTMTVNGSRTYRFSGDWSADLTVVDGGAFTADVVPNCEKAKA